MLLKLQAILGIIIFLGFCWLISSDRKNAKLSVAIAGIGIQIALALLIFNIPFFQTIFKGLNYLVASLQAATLEGTKFVFGYVGGGPAPFVVAPGQEGYLFIFVFQALPLLVVASAITSLLFYWRVIPFIIKQISKVFENTLGIGGALGLSSSATIFFGLDIAPLIIRPHLKDMSRSELFSLMTCGMATVSSSVMVLYVQILGHVLSQHDVLGHILTASVLNVPAALTVSRLILPHVGHTTSASFEYNTNINSSMDAITQGVSDVIMVFLNIAAMLLVLTSLVFLINSFLVFIPHPENYPFTLQTIFGYLFAPIMWIMGIPINEVISAGQIMGIKTVLNEIFAYQSLAGSTQVFSEHTRLILLYAVCGFANFSSVGIAIGALGSLIPQRRSEIVSLGFKSIVSGTIATCLTGTIVGMLL